MDTGSSSSGRAAVSIAENGRADSNTVSVCSAMVKILPQRTCLDHLVDMVLLGQAGGAEEDRTVTV